MSDELDRAERMGGPNMIQDHDHMTGQMGGEPKSTGGRQAQQSENQSRQQGDSQESGGAQQGGEPRRRRSKLL